MNLTDLKLNDFAFLASLIHFIKNLNSFFQIAKTLIFLLLMDLESLFSYQVKYLSCCTCDSRKASFNNCNQDLCVNFIQIFFRSHSFVFENHSILGKLKF